MARYVKVRGQGGAIRSVKIGGNGLTEGALRQMVSAGEAFLVDDKPAAKPEPENTPEPITEDSAAEPTEAPAPKRRPGRPRKTTTTKTENTNGDQ